MRLSFCTVRKKRMSTERPFLQTDLQKSAPPDFQRCVFRTPLFSLPLIYKKAAAQSRCFNMYHHRFDRLPALPAKVPAFAVTRGPAAVRRMFRRMPSKRKNIRGKYSGSARPFHPVPYRFRIVDNCNAYFHLPAHCNTEIRTFQAHMRML